MMKRILFGLVCYFASFQAANASTVFDSLTNPPYTQDGYGNPADFEGIIYQSFSTNAGVLTNLQLGIKPGQGDLGYLIIRLFSDQGSMPGSFLTNLGTVADTSGANFVWDSGLLSYSLDAGRYWIGVSTSIDPYSSSGWTATMNTTEIGSELISIPGVFTLPVSDAGMGMQMKVDVDSDSAVPEPVTMVLSGLGLGAIIVFKKSRAV